MSPTHTAERIGGYRVVRRLASGNTSDVLLAKAEGPHGFERTVVLKRLLSQYQGDEGLAKMFAREAAAYARLSHPAIVQLYDFFQHDGQLVMVLEYVDGAPLSRLRGMLKAVGRVFDDKAALFVAERIFAALAAAHASSGEGGVRTPVIHRDVNPSNVLVSWDGQVKLADFGIAKVTGVTHESTAGLIKGTYGYMAPEQVEGGVVTPAVDVYAAGIILWEMLTRRRAFQRGALPEIEVLRAMAEPKIAPIDVLRPDVDERVRQALRLALEPRAESRRITAEEMVATLERVAPPDEGRERLAELLATVRHEPRPTSTSMPPPIEVEPLEAPTLPPKKPRPAPPRLPSASRMAAAAPPRPGPPKTKSGPLPAVVAPPRPPATSSPNISLSDAIDEVLSGVPSSIPPGVLTSLAPSADPPETSRMLGHLPPPPPPLHVTMPLAPDPPPPPPASPGPEPLPELASEPPPPSFPPLEHTLAFEPRIAPAPIYTPPQPAPAEMYVPPPPRSSRAGLVVALLFVTLVVAGAGVFGYRKYLRAAAAVPTATASAVPVPSVVPSAVPTPSADPDPVPSASASAIASATEPETEAAPEIPPEIPPDMGVVHTTGTSAGRRIFVDERTLGQTPESVTVKCGSRAVRLGSSGRRQTIDVPCGGAVTVGDR